MVRIFLKDGNEHEIPEEWIRNWEELHYNVQNELRLAVEWSKDFPEKRKTRRGLRGFLGNWIRRKCTLKPKVVEIKSPQPVALEPLESRKERLAELKKALG